jgi:hypothetical protein
MMIDDSIRQQAALECCSKGANNIPTVAVKPLQCLLAFNIRPHNCLTKVTSYTCQPQPAAHRSAATAALSHTLLCLSKRLKDMFGYWKAHARK